MSVFQISLDDSAESFPCAPGQNVLSAMERRGLVVIPVGCRGGGCGICRVQVLGSGHYRTGKMSRAKISEKDEALGICLACKLIPESNLRLRVLGQWQNTLLADRVSGR